MAVPTLDASPKARLASASSETQTEPLTFPSCVCSNPRGWEEGAERQKHRKSLLTVLGPRVQHQPVSGSVRFLCQCFYFRLLASLWGFSASLWETQEGKPGLYFLLQSSEFPILHLGVGGHTPACPKHKSSVILECASDWQSSPYHPKNPQKRR